MHGRIQVALAPRFCLDRWGGNTKELSELQYTCREGALGASQVGWAQVHVQARRAPALAALVQRDRQGCRVLVDEVDQADLSASSRDSVKAPDRTCRVAKPVPSTKQPSPAVVNLQVAGQAVGELCEQPLELMPVHLWGCEFSSSKWLPGSQQALSRSGVLT